MKINPISPVSGVNNRLMRDIQYAEKLDEADEELVQKIHEALINQNHKLHGQMMAVLSDDAKLFHDGIKSYQMDKGGVSVEDIERKIRKFFKARKALIKALKDVLES